MKFLKFTFSQLVSYGVHIGHTWKNSVLFSSWMVYGFRQDILIIDLSKFIISLRTGFVLLKFVLKYNNPVWFINLDTSMNRFVRFSALRCGEFFVSLNWINGMLSNYISVFNAYRRLGKLSFLVKKQKQVSAEVNFKNWLFTRFTWPRVVFVSSVVRSYIACKEAFSLGIPCMGIVDTDSYSQIVSLPLPGNDETLECLVFYNELISNYILYYKFRFVFIWFVNIRKFSRKFTFVEWVNYQFKNKTIEKNLYTYYIKNKFFSPFKFFYTRNQPKLDSFEKVFKFENITNTVTNNILYTTFHQSKTFKFLYLHCFNIKKIKNLW